MLLLYGQQLSRITTITTDQVTTRGEQVFLRFSQDDVLIPEPLDCLLQPLLRDGRRYQGVGSPTLLNAPPRNRLQTAIRRVGTLPITSMAAGVPVKVVSERLGHASAMITLGVYAHVMPGMPAESAASFGTLLTGGA